MEFLDKKIEDYISAHSDKEPQILADLNRETWAKVLMPRMLSGHIQGRVLSLFSNLLRPLNIIEIGTYTGYSALCLAEGIKKKGELHTIEINEEHALIAEKYFKKSKFSKNIKQHIGNALEIIPKINKKFQLAFIDADKENYSKYFEKGDELLSKQVEYNSENTKILTVNELIKLLKDQDFIKKRLN